MKLIIALRILPVIQIALYIWAITILYSAGHDDVSDFSGLAALLPFGVFMLLGVVHAILFINYLTKVFQKKIAPEILILGLAAILVILFTAFPFIYPLTQEPWQPPTVQELQR